MFVSFSKHCSWKVYKMFMNRSSKRTHSWALAKTVHELFINCSWTVRQNQSVTNFGKHGSWTFVWQTVYEGVHEQTGKQITLGFGVWISTPPDPMRSGVWVLSSLSMYTSIYLCIHMFAYLSIYLSISLSIYLSISTLISISLFLSLSFGFGSFLSLSLCLFPLLFHFLSLSLPLSLSFFLSIYLSIDLYFSSSDAIKSKEYICSPTPVRSHAALLRLTT
jgi:hypothetical protein